MEGPDPEESPVDGVRQEILARERLMTCMQDLIRGLGQANADLARQLAQRRSMLQGPVINEERLAGSEALLVACGAAGIISLPGTNGVNEQALAVMSEMSGPAPPGDRLLVNRIQSGPRWQSAAALARGASPEQSARLVTLATDVLCLRMARPLWRPVQEAAGARAAMESAAVMLLDRDGNLRCINRAFAELTGLDGGELPAGRWYHTLVTAEDWELMRAAEAEGWCGSGKGRVVWIKGRQRAAFPVMMFRARLREAAGEVAVLIDWTRQHEQMEDQARQERLYRRFFEEEVTGHYACTPDGRIIECNQAFASIFGFASTEEARRCNLRQLHVNGAAADHFLELLRKHGRLVYHESSMRRVDGREIQVIRNVTAKRNERGELVEISGYLFDNTERHRIEERLRQSQKMETVGRLAGGIAHDFNNLLLAIQGYATLLADQVADNPENSESVRQIQNAADRATTLTRQLLAFSRRQVLQPTELNLNDTIQALSPLLQRLLGENISLVAQLAPDLWTVHADGGRIEEALVNLVSNAHDAMPGGGQAVIATRNAQLQDTWFPFHDGPPPGDYVELTVQDNGTGMTEDVKAHLFEPFYTTKGQGKGTGLGLSTVYGIVKQSGGEVQVYSAEGKGTSFKILLPRHGGRSSRDAGSAAGPERSQWRILVVEDEIAVRLLVKKILERAGHRVIDAAGGPEALALVETSGEAPPDLLLTDLVMPGMSGRELWEHLAARRPGMPVIYMSGYTEDAVVKHGIMQEKVHFLQKPFKPDALLARVREAMINV